MQLDNVTRHVHCALVAAAFGVLACSSNDSTPTFAGTGEAGNGGASAGSAGSAGATGSGTISTGAGGTTGVTGVSTGTTGGATIDASSGAAGSSSGAGGASGSAGTADAGGAEVDAGSTCANPGIDSDSDGTPDCLDLCPFDKDKILPGTCGCGTAENDSDGDGTVDCLPGHFYEAEDGHFSIEGSDAGASADGASAIDGSVPSVGFTIGDAAAASKGHYIAAATGIQSADRPGPARASYDLSITKADAYVIWGRFYAPDSVRNCVWARVDGGNWIRWRGTTGETWFWYHLHNEGEWATPLIFQFSAGHHDLTIASCVDDTKLDRLYVTAGGDRPPGDQTICNPPHTVEIGGQCASSCGLLGGNSCDVVACAGQTLLPAYDCNVCCTVSAGNGDAGNADADAAASGDADAAASGDTGAAE